MKHVAQQDSPESDYETIDSSCILKLLFSATRDQLVALCARVGCLHASYRMARAVGSNYDAVFLRTTLPSDWTSNYLLSGLAMSDPVVSHGFEARNGFFWDSLPNTEQSRFFFEMCNRLSMPTVGYSLPIMDTKGRRALLSLSGTSCAEQSLQEAISKIASQLPLLAQEIHVTALLELHGGTDPAPILSPRERECLRWTAAGKTHAEIAIILGLSEHTIRGYLKSLRLKLGSTTLAQAVSKAGILDIA